MQQGRTARVASVRRDQRLSLCWKKPVLTGSKTDPLLVKAETIGDTGDTSV